MTKNKKNIKANRKRKIATNKAIKRKKLEVKSKKEKRLLRAFTQRINNVSKQQIEKRFKSKVTDNPKQDNYTGPSIKNKIDLPDLNNQLHHKIPFPKYLSVSSIKKEKIRFNPIKFENLSDNFKNNDYISEIIKLRFNEFRYFSISSGRMLHLYNLATERINSEQFRRTYTNVTKPKKDLLFRLRKPFCDKMVKQLFEKHYKLIISDKYGDEINTILLEEVKQRITMFMQPPNALTADIVEQTIITAYIAHLAINFPATLQKDNYDLLHNLKVNYKNYSTFNRFKPYSLNRAVQTLPTQTTSCLPNMKRKIEDRKSAVSISRQVLNYFKDNDFSILDYHFNYSMPCLCFTRTPVTLGEEGIISEQIRDTKNLKFDPNVSARIIYGAPD